VAPHSSPTEGWGYAPLKGHWDEAVLPSGLARRHWRQLAVAMRRMDFRQFDRYWQSGGPLIREAGIASSVAGDPWASERPLPLDPIPLVIAESEWTQIEPAVAQRAALLNAILADVYGPQRLVREQHLPPALVFGNPQFLRPCSGITPADGRYLLTYAVDLGRAPDGRWRVIADRTQEPTGIGYTLENRLVSARALSSVFSQCRVRQLARFFDLRRDALLAAASRRSKTPRVVVLTPGSSQEGYFEHSFLAGYWGFPLVVGDDLTVREGGVYLKTLAGLEPVDLILRRVDADFCDPLELRGDSSSGVPGLVQAARAGAVIVDNPLGSGLLEAPGYLACMPALCREFLGEELRLPSVATWWCGQDSAWAYVLEHLDALVIKPASPSFGHQSEFPASMDAAARAKLAAKIQAHPARYVAQEGIALSTAPARAEAGLAARYVVMRVFAIWDGQSYAVMPGGLARLTTEHSSHRLTASLGGVSKDTWVLGSSSETTPALGDSPVWLEGYSNPGALASRVADNLFWLGRYTERLEANVRLLRALLPALSAEEDFGRAVTLETAVFLLVAMHFLPPEEARASLAEQRWRLQRFLTEMVYDPSRTSSLGWNLKQMRRVARQLKERLSSDTWRVLQQLEAEFSRVVPAHPEHRFSAHLSALDRAVMTLSAFSGLLLENTTRGTGWRFLELGRRLERALQMAEVLRAAVVEVPPDTEPHLHLLLQFADSSITYRARYLSLLRTDWVLQLLLLDESNPRSLAFQLDAVVREAGALEDHDAAQNGRLGDLASNIQEEVCRADTAELARRDGEGRFAALGSWIEHLQANLYAFSEGLTEQFMSPAKPARLLSTG